MSSSTSHIAAVAVAAAGITAAWASGDGDAFKTVMAGLSFINIAKMIANVGHGGIGLDGILMELLDNSLKALARAIHVHLISDTRDGKLNSLVFEDNGTGMTLAEFINALFLGSDREYTADDLGSFGMGLKNATWALGSTIVIITKTASGTAFGAVMDLEKMKKANTLKPTVITGDVESLAYFFPDDTMDRFRMLPSGTLILIKDIRHAYVTDVKTHLHEARRSLNMTYRDLAGAAVHLHCDGPSGESLEIFPLDVFCRKSPEKLRYAGHTVLRVYKKETGRGVDVYEALTGERVGGCIKSKRISQIFKGTSAAPLFHKLTLVSKTTKSGAVRTEYPQDPVKASEMPSGDFNEILVRFVELTPTAYAAEGEKDDYAHLDQRRRGIMCIRVNRRVSGFLTFGEKLDDHDNRFRMEVVFPPALDAEMGVRTQKQIDGKLNNSEIQDALRVLWHVQLTERKRIYKAELGERADEESVVSDTHSAAPAPALAKKATKKASPPAATSDPALPTVIELIAPPEVAEGEHSRAASTVADAPAAPALSLPHLVIEAQPAVLPASPNLRSTVLNPIVLEDSVPLFSIEDHFSFTIEQLLDCAEERGYKSELMALLSKILHA